MNFKERLKSLISKKGCTQKSLADYVGVKPNTVSDWVNKGTSPKIEHIYLIAQFFEVSFNYLFAGKESIINDNCLEVISNVELEMISYFRKLPQKEQYIELGRLQTISEKFDMMEKNVI